MRCRVMGVVLCGSWIVAGPLEAQGLGSAFTYQGRLADGGSPANGAFDLRFILYDAAAGGAQVGPIVTVDDAPVATGLFTVTLDFGAGAFRGAARWLEVAARPGASTGAYTVIGGRQELKPSPNAVFSSAAAEVPWTGVSGKPAGFADNVDNDSGGTVTSVATGAGLTGGPITGSGSVSVASGGIVSGMIANGAVGAAQINQAQVQTRISGVCPLGSYLRGINPDGTVVCTGLNSPHAITTVANASQTATPVPIAVAPDGRPVIAYQGASNGGDMHFLKCANAACSTFGTFAFLEPPNPNNVGTGASIAIGSDGLPIVSYHDATLGTLKTAKCGNPSCSSGTIVTTVDDHPVNVVGADTSIAIGVDGFPVISYLDGTAGALKVAKCVNVNCTGLNVITTVDDTANSVGHLSAIAIGADGFPVIAHQDATSRTLRVVKCNNASCSGGVAITPAATGAHDKLIDIAVPADGRPVISYVEIDVQFPRHRVLKCGNAACSSGNSNTVIDELFSGGTSIAIGADGLPIVSYGTQLRVAQCGNAACSAGNLISILDQPLDASVGHTSSIAVGPDGLPVIAYLDSTNHTLKVAKCGTPACN